MSTMKVHWQGLAFVHSKLLKKESNKKKREREEWWSARNCSNDICKSSACIQFNFGKRQNCPHWNSPEFLVLLAIHQSLERATKLNAHWNVGGCFLLNIGACWTCGKNSQCTLSSLASFALRSTLLWGGRPTSAVSMRVQLSISLYPLLLFVMHVGKQGILLFSGETFEDAVGFESHLSEDRHQFHASTVQPVINLRHDLKKWLSDNSRHLQGEQKSAILQQAMAVLDEVESVKAQQKQVCVCVRERRKIELTA